MDKRLLTCAKLCKGRRIADIGTDHGYLPCYMISQGLCDSAVACDVAPLPLESAQQHIKAKNLQGKIQTVLSDGLKNVPPEGITDIVIAGMGGELIAKILEECSWLKAAKPPVNLVLQPMTKWDHLRRWLYDNDFEVTDELACTVGKFSYSVMQAVYIGRRPPYPCDLKYLYCGSVTAGTDEGKEYLLRQKYRLETAAKGMIRSVGKENTAHEMLELADQLDEDIVSNYEDL